MLQFFGRGSAFADQHNAAFFREQGDLILLDCPGTAFQKVKRFDWSNVFNVYVLITHTTSADWEHCCNTCFSRNTNA